jgi:hypothetical protein
MGKSICKSDSLVPKADTFHFYSIDVTSLIETPFGGRYCGKIGPRLRISLYRVLSFVFNSDRENITESRFTGTFTFIPNGKLKEIFSN